MISLEPLDPKFKNTCDNLFRNCLKQGCTVLPFYGVRDVKTQAALWRQSRPVDEIMITIHRLKREGAPFLASIMEVVGPQEGRWATNCLPGQSWHQWGLAVDCYVVGENGKSVWSSKHPSYRIYADEAQKLGLTSGYYWTRQDAVHVQAVAEGVRAVYTWPEIDRAMKEKFGG